MVNAVKLHLDEDPQLQLIILLSMPQAATLWPDKILGLLQQVEPETFIRLVRYHRVALAVSQNLLSAWRDLLPEAVLAQLEQQKTQHLQQVRQQYFIQTRLEIAFSKAGIQHRFFKGLTLSKLLYQDLGWRYSKDIDLLVQPAEREQAARLLQSQGFVSEFAALPANGLGTRILKFIQKDCHYYHADGTVLELHWRLSNEHCCFSRFMTKQFLQAQSGVTAEEFVYLCWHAAKSQCHRLKWLIDVVAYASKLQQTEPDWQTTAERIAASNGALPQLLLMLLLAQRCYPGLLATTLQAGRIEQHRLEAILRSWQHAVLPARATISTAMRSLLMQSEPSALARAMLNLAYWPNPDDIKLLNSLPRPLNYLFLPLFPFFKIGRYLVRRCRQLTVQLKARISDDPTAS